MIVAKNLRHLVRLQPVLLGVGFTLLIAISFATVLLVNRAADDTRRLAQTLHRQDQLSNILLVLRRAESSQRGYLFTGQQSYLDEYSGAQAETNSIIVDLQPDSDNNPRRERLLAEIKSLVDAKFKEMQATIDLNRAGRSDQARALVVTNAGRAIMRKIRAIVEDAIREEVAIADKRSDASHQTNFTALLMTLAGTGLIFLIGIVSVALVQKNYRRAEEANLELQVTNSNLERIVEYRTADLVEANEEIQRFAYIVSHDLRSPLVNVMGFTTELETLRKEIFEKIEALRTQLAGLNAQAASAEDAAITQIGEDFDEAIGFVKTSIANMDRLINAILKLSREGRRQFHPETVELKELIDAIIQNVSHRAAEMGATLTVGDLPAIETDRLAMEQIFANLVDNALKYSRDEPLTVEISARPTASHVSYDVKDNGRGIDKNDFQRVFELFRRSGKQDRPGEGIGLAHVRALVRRLGGTMGLQSELGKGSTFTVTLPRRWSVDSRSA